MILRNFTPHAINFYKDEKQDQPFLVLPSEGVARASEIREYIGHVSVNGQLVPIYKISYGRLEGLPEPQENVLFVVSSIAHSAAMAEGRRDTCSPGIQLRDDEGRVIGCVGLSR